MSSAALWVALLANPFVFLRHKTHKLTMFFFCDLSITTVSGAQSRLLLGEER